VGNSAAYVALRQMLAENWSIGRIWPLEPVLRVSPDQLSQLNDTMTPLDGVVLVIYMLGSPSPSAQPPAVSGRRDARLRKCRGRVSTILRRADSTGGCGVFLGLSSLTVTMLKRRALLLLVARRGRCCCGAGCGRCGSAAHRPDQDRVASASTLRPCFSQRRGGGCAVWASCSGELLTDFPNRQMW